MENKFITWENFVSDFGNEMASAEDVHENMVQSGLQENCLSKMDFTFVSDRLDNLYKLGEYIKANYPYTIKETKPFENIWEINGETNEIPITRDNLLYWVLDMYKRGYEFDSKLDAYGAMFDPQNQVFPIFDSNKEEVYFEKGLKCYGNGDLSGAIINWSLALIINPNNPNSYYSRAIVKNELYTWKSALHDYDKAIEIAPDFVSALTNRGSLKDENGDFQGAIDDYNKVLAMDKIDLENEQMALFNRGNSKFNLSDKIGACEDWKKSYELGADYAKHRLDKSCK